MPRCCPNTKNAEVTVLELSVSIFDCRTRGHFHGLRVGFLLVNEKVYGLEQTALQSDQRGVVCRFKGSVLYAVITHQTLTEALGKHKHE